MGQFLRLHETPDAFRKALQSTQAASGFAQHLIEKDYYCSLILADFAPLFSGDLVFKGGTCLSKVYVGFYRLSEDLDFAISIPTTARPQARREACLPVKRHLEQIAERLPTIRTFTSLQGHDGSRQYNAILQYESAVTGEHESVKVQLAIREPIIEATVCCCGRTLLRHPTGGEMADTELSLRVLSLHEAYAEKVRAALTRKPPAIRDIFDIDEAVRAKRLDFFQPEFISLVRQKLAVPRNAVIDTSQNRTKELEDQLETHLKPVLRSFDYATFDIDRALATINRLAILIRGDCDIH
jgi:predicted nucleotidyltransferase component of viral defense system